MLSAMGLDSVRKIILIAIASTAVGGAARAAEYLSEVKSEVYQTSGDQAAIARRAKGCFARKLAPGMQGGQLIVSDDGATIVANNVFDLAWGLGVRSPVRSKVTFEARDGRFRISHEAIEMFNDTGPIGWRPVGKWTGSPWKKVEGALQTVSSDVATCVQATKADDW